MTPTATVQPTATPVGGTLNLAQGKTMSASNYNSLYPPNNANDGDVTTYFESASLPATLTVDLGGQATFNSVNVLLNPATIWSARTQTFAILTSNDNSTWTTLVPSTQIVLTRTPTAMKSRYPLATPPPDMYS